MRYTITVEQSSRVEGGPDGGWFTAEAMVFRKGDTITWEGRSWYVRDAEFDADHNMFYLRIGDTAPIGHR